MRTRKINILIALLLSMTLVLSSCWKEDLDDCPQIPQTGRVILATEWDNRGAGVAIPSEYRASIGDWSGTLTGLRNEINHEFAPGNHHINVYTRPAGMDINGLMAEVQSTGTAGFINPLPGFLFTRTSDVVDLKKNETRNILAPMTQQTAVVTYEIRMSDNSPVNNYISAVTSATVGNIASKINLETGALSNAASIQPAFSLSGGKYVAETRVLGTIGSSQMLTLDLTLAGTGAPQTLSRDIATELVNLNANKTGAYHIIIIITALDDLTGRITDWMIGDGLTGEID